MWTALTDPSLLRNISELGSAYAPLGHLVEQLAKQPYAPTLYAVTSHMHLSLTTAPAFNKGRGHDMVCVDYNPENGLFDIAYDEWVSPTRNPNRKTTSKDVCESEQALAVIVNYVTRLLMCRNNAHDRSE